MDYQWNKGKHLPVYILISNSVPFFDTLHDRNLLEAGEDLCPGKLHSSTPSSSAHQKHLKVAPEVRLQLPQMNINEHK